jgi:invasion protein IalB
MVFALAASTASEAVSVQIALPLGVDISAGARIIIGDGYQNQIPLQRCTAQGCIIEGYASDELLDAMKRARGGAVVVENEVGQQIQLPFSLMGFTDAYKAMLES